MNDDIVENDIDVIVENIRDFSKILQEKTILIVGGRGFLGTYFVKTIQKLNQSFEKPCKILVADNRITEKNLQEFNDPNIRFLEVDISKKVTIDDEIDSK